MPRVSDTDTETPADTEPVTETPTPERILVIVAHPDDVDFGCAGSVATWTDAGIAVTYCLVTSGDAGGTDRTQSFEHRASIREAEQRAAAAEVGVSDLIFLRHPDGQVMPTLELRHDLSRVIREVRPDRVVTQSSELNLDRIYASHPDHRATAIAAIDAVYPDARNPFAHTDLLDAGLEPWAVPEVWVMAISPTGGGTPAYVDITDAFDRKLAALRAHASQMEGKVGYDEMLRTWSTAIAQAGGLPEGRLAEAFRVVNTR